VLQLLLVLLVLFSDEAGRSSEIKVSQGMDSWAERQTQEY